MDGISRSRGLDKEIPHGVLPMEQLVLSDNWARKNVLKLVNTAKISIWWSRKDVIHIRKL